MPRGRKPKLKPETIILPCYPDVAGQRCIEDGDMKCKRRASCPGCELRHYCAYHDNGEGSLCIHYTGSHRYISSCYDKCNLDERHKSKRFTKPETDQERADRIFIEMCSIIKLSAKEKRLYKYLLDWAADKNGKDPTLGEICKALRTTARTYFKTFASLKEKGLAP